MEGELENFLTPKEARAHISELEKGTKYIEFQDRYADLKTGEDGAPSIKLSDLAEKINPYPETLTYYNGRRRAGGVLTMANSLPKRLETGAGHTLCFSGLLIGFGGRVYEKAHAKTMFDGSSAEIYAVLQKTRGGTTYYVKLEDATPFLDAWVKILAEEESGYSGSLEA